MNPWNKRFQGEDYVYGTEPNAFVVDMQRRLSLSGRTLAIAEGEGRNAVYLAGHGHEVTVWDYAEAGLNKANKLAKERALRLQPVFRICRMRLGREISGITSCAYSGIFRRSCASGRFAALRRR